MSTADESIVARLDMPLETTVLERGEMQRAQIRGGAGHGEFRFEVDLRAEALEKMRKHAVVEPNIPGYSAFSVSCDEGTPLQGEDAAPPPLSYLAAGVAFCLLTHLAEYVRVEKLAVDRISVEQKMRFATNNTPTAIRDGTAGGRCEGVDTYLLVEGSESPERIGELARLSKQACMAMQTVLNPIPDSMTITLNGEPLPHEAEQSHQ
jgi:uncharacterized OsmC-like protein